MSVCVRRAIESDRARILEISDQIWGGEDYVPELLEGWFTDREGELVVATLDTQVIAFAHRTWLCPGIAWFEGIRTDPAFQGRGAGKAITEYLIRAARGAGATHIELSTYIDNEASIHIIESYGFQLVGAFSYLERPIELELPESVKESSSIRAISEQETIEFVSSSEFLFLACRRFPRGWHFFPFDHDPCEAIARLECRLGFWEGDGLKGVMCIRQGPDHEGRITVNFLDGEPAAMCILLNHALVRYEGKTMQIMVPIHQGRHPAVLPLLRQSGFRSWSEFKADVFVYEMLL
ncbi:GNAT family N-acetyltransferase [Candidatus Bipolaricaulota bacterium]